MLGLCYFTNLQAFLPAAPRGAALRRAGAAGGRGLVCRAAGGDTIEVEGTVEPVGSHILVKVPEVSEFSVGGILLPKQETPKGGEVVAVGPGEADSKTGMLRPVEVKPGAKVVYSRYGGSTTVKCSGVEHVLVRQDEILYSYESEEATLADVKMPRGMLLVKLEEAKEETSSGLLLSKDATKPSTTSGEVVAVGDGELLANGETMAIPAEVGDMVRFRYGDEVELDIGEDRFSAVKMSNCIAKWKAA